MTFTIPTARAAAHAGPTPRSIAVDLAGRPGLWRPLVEFRHPRHYVRLLAGDGWEAWLLTWLPGQATGLHDHGGSAGAFAVVQGALDESLLVRDGGVRAAPAGRRSARPEGGRLTLQASRYRSGAVRAFGARHLHDVQAADVASVSIHVYAPALTSMTRYTLDDGVLWAVAHERAGASW